MTPNAAYWSGDEWRWRLKQTGHQTSIEVIEPAEPRCEPKNARRVAFGFSRALEAEMLDALDRWDEEHRDDWSDHATMVAG
jgi:hypothetical protein